MAKDDKALVERLRADALDAESTTDTNGLLLEAASTIERLSAIEQERDALREALSELVDTLEPTERGPIKDPHYGDEVLKIGRRMGFGALMASAEYEWRAWLAENGYPLGSEFVSGPCRAVLDSDMKKARAALNQSRTDATEDDPQRANRFFSGPRRWTAGDPDGGSD